MDKAQQDALKKAAGIEAARLIENGMIAGLGTGSTVKFLVDELGRRVKEEGLEFTGVTTSRRTQEQAESYGIKIVDVDDVDHIDITIDGADEVDSNFNGIKGGGAALLWEKIVATNSNKIVWIVDESKVVNTIGAFPLPVEVIPFGAGHVIKKFESRGYKPTLRLDASGKEVRTDESNFVVDLHLDLIEHPQALADDLITTVGVVEHGLFLNMVDTVIVGNPDGPRVMTNSNK
ncbi:ribose-5-phosphate isomerase RpiA [Bifidobacterium panos]|uniref:Ribose-5-phosphate isomerase A n=1 Tax=Bifidobacterium panos TaxID=2675321 RepID=A0ABX1SUA1_9BIFI|nr:ribose-5-phosphate isomerase RpiA [Bifidobacterium sp. DSM 109963]NMN01400.1 ribose-5-phosphate isomerase [Bifidobacterium sp. DSM 109963]